MSLERSGGYAALVGLILIGVFWLARHQISEQAQRSSDREEATARRHAEEIERVGEFLARERMSSAEHRQDKQLLIAVVQSNTEAETALAELVRSSIDLQRQTNERLIGLDRFLHSRDEGTSGE